MKRPAATGSPDPAHRPPEGRLEAAIEAFFRELD